MIDFLILNGSPRARGNCSALSARAAASAEKASVKCRRFDISRLHIAPCSACDLCKDGKVRYCSLDDDMSAIYEAFMSCRSVLLISPIYWFTFSSQLKTVIDRLYGLWCWNNDFLKGKRVGSSFVYGDVDVWASGAVNAISTVEHMLRFTGAENAGFAYGTANDPGDAEGNADFIARFDGLVDSLIRGEASV